MQMHSVKPSKVTELWTRHMNDLVFRTVQMFPTRFRAVAGLPQYRDESPTNSLAELEFRVKEQGFIGCLLNPDPTEGDGAPPPGLGEEFWYPLYEKLCELDIPALIHSAGSCSPRESYTLKFINEESIGIISLMNSDVFEKFPNLKLIFPHGGGAIPYHMGRFRSWSRRKGGEYFDDKLKRLHFDTTTYDKNALELLFKTVGVDRVLFATENPGTGSAIDPETGRGYDDLKPIIENISFLSDEDRKNIFECNCTKLYSRFRKDE
jgi:4-oxalmesaconate hydratase